MKKLFSFFVIVVIAISFASCTSNEDLNEDLEYTYEECCDMCETPILDDEHIEVYYGDYLCFACAFHHDYTNQCKSCDLYFQSGGTNYYCEICAEENSARCCFCEERPLDFDQLVEFSYNGTSYHMCVNCCSEYFYNTPSVPPCWGCSYCGEILGGTPFPLYDCDDTDLYMVCRDCLTENSLKKCIQCKKYYDEGKNGLCPLCHKKQTTNN